MPTFFQGSSMLFTNRSVLFFTFCTCSKYLPPLQDFDSPLASRSRSHLPKVTFPSSKKCFSPTSCPLHMLHMSHTFHMFYLPPSKALWATNFLAHSKVLAHLFHMFILHAYSISS